MSVTMQLLVQKLTSCWSKTKLLHETMLTHYQLKSTQPFEDRVPLDSRYYPHMNSTDVKMMGVGTRREMRGTSNGY